MTTPLIHGPGHQPLLNEDQAISLLALGDRPNPKGALRWLVRTRKLGYVRLARGLYRFRLEDLQAFIDRQHVKALL